MADRARLARPRVVLPLLGAMLVAFVLFSPTAAEQRGRLSSYSTAAGGARALHDVAQRLGWRVERRTAPFTAVPEPAAVYAVLEPLQPLTTGEVHRLLEAVRAGAGLLVVAPARGTLADSLGVRRSSEGGVLPLAPEGFCPDSLNRYGLITWPDARVWSWWLRRHPTAGAVVLATVETDSATLAADAEAAEDEEEGADDEPVDVLRGAVRGRVDTIPLTDTVPLDELAAGAPDTAESAPIAVPAIVGFPLGRGRVVAVADPDLLRNDVLRVCRWNTGPLAVRALDWLAPAGGRRLVFDEYHHGYGTHANPVAATRDALVGTAPGRMVLQLAAAALVLLAAAGLRPLAPRPRAVIERRSPLEHVGALARAYEQVGATRLAARRLVRGLRRRHAVGLRAGGSDEAFLHQVAARRPALASDVQLLAQAVADGVPRDALPAVGDAVARIDQHLRPDS